MDKKELKERQGWSLDKKIDHSLFTIETFLSRVDGKAYVGFSGGKDSTVLLDLCRIIKPDIKAVFCNTGNEYPDIVRFVRELKNTEGYNVEIIYPKMKPGDVLKKYGFPLISKEVSEKLYYVKYHNNSMRAKIALGLSPSKWYVLSKKWISFVYEKFDVNNKCCKVLKKHPFEVYDRKNNLFPILRIMASESRQRETTYVRQGGCNVFAENGKGKTKSLPLSIWLEDDIWAYIQKRNLKIAEIYRKGAKRTGCMFCGYGCQFKDDNRLQMIYEMYPKMYDTFMNYTNNGVTYREALRKVLAVNGLYLPDERPADLFTGIKD